LGTLFLKLQLAEVCSQTGVWEQGEGWSMKRTVAFEPFYFQGLLTAFIKLMLNYDFAQKLTYLLNLTN
jgi:hypothetical protein